MTRVTDFIALDVETANADVGSICSVGLVHFRAGQIFKSLSILVDPQGPFDPGNVAIHGIRASDVIGKPTMAEVFPVLAQSLNGTIVAHHSSFDRRAFASAAARYGVAELQCFWLDTLAVARRSWREFADAGGFGLANLSRSFEIEFRHHQADEDARACGLIMLKALEDSGLDLEDWLDLVARAPKPAIRSAPKVIVPRRSEAFARYAQSGDRNGRLVGETVVFTGFLQMHRSEAAHLAVKAGCNVVDAVSGKVTVLVVGDQDLRLTRGNVKSRKHRKVEEMIAAGSSVRIVGESEFLQMVG
jgi:DNA polymerase III subunit epsilon